MIDFSLSPEALQAQERAHKLGKDVLRKIARYYDENEHEESHELKALADELRDSGGLKGPGNKDFLNNLLIMEELCWGDMGLNSMNDVVPFFDSDRMADEYYTNLFNA